MAMMCIKYSSLQHLILDNGDMNLMNSVEGMNNMFTGNNDDNDIWTVYGTNKCGWTQKQKVI